MRTSLRIFGYKLFALLCVLFTGVAAFAQDEGSTSQTTVVHTSNASTASNPDLWYMQPWVWVAAGAVVILLIVLLVRGDNGGHQEVTRTTKVTTDVKSS